ncbi:hypothetical protein FSP39_000749 [Pinctada imbricata]|uniref:Uncharacterized protein n=1 Tax=Pinctada imbricata TaxID=66713 RepID=A0AA88XKM9_PINIB|nr:hypothetical protein FSP39_000749 [Pinctada imbricata]
MSTEEAPPYSEKNGNINLGYEKGDDEDKKFKNGISKKEKDLEKGKDEKEYDPWDLPELKITETPWDELTTGGKFKRVIWTTFRVILFLGFLYLFICSLDFLSSAFRLLGGRAAGEVFRDNELLSNPVCGVMIGVLATVLVQSSSTSTSIVVSMVGSGLLTVDVAIPIVMGANIGTSVTNTIVALFQITSKDDFRRAFAGATVHDMFNWLTVIILLPIEAATGYLFHLSKVIVDTIDEGNENADVDLLKVITSPFTKKVIEVDKGAITKIAKDQGDEVKTLQKMCCGKKYDVFNATTNATEEFCTKECSYLFYNTGMSDAALGLVMLVLSLLILCICLVAIVKILHSLLQGNIRKWIRSFVNAEFPGKAKYFTGYLAILLGMGITILVQSSSIFTSSITPLVGVGVIKIERMYPLTLGSNIGTTTTGILAALANDDLKDLKNSLQIAFCHLFFNISGILIFYPIPFMRFPIGLAKFLGEETAKYRWYAIAYLIFMFILFPLSIFGLSVAGWYVLVAVYTPILLIAIIVIIIKVIQNKKPGILPRKLQNWKILPEPLRSLDPYDRAICGPCRESCNKHCTCCNDEDEEESKWNKYIIRKASKSADTRF